jgi:hypothetical protein
MLDSRKRSCVQKLMFFRLKFLHCKVSNAALRFSCTQNYRLTIAILMQNYKIFVNYAILLLKMYDNYVIMSIYYIVARNIRHLRIYSRLHESAYSGLP